MSSWELDADVNVWVEQRGYDLDVSGTTDLWHIDSTGDGVFDQIGLDTTGEGVADTWFADPNVDGVADHVWTDTTGDGIADTWHYAQPGTSMGWEHFAAPTGGPTVGTIGGDTGGDWTITDAAGNPVDPNALIGPSTVGGTSPDWTITDAAGNPVDPTSLIGPSTVGPTPMTGLDYAFVQARQSGSLWDQIAIYNMIQQQNSMIYNGIDMM